MPAQLDQSEGPLYSDALLPQLQQALAALADLQVRYEIDRDYLEDWSGPAQIRDRLVIELNEWHAKGRERLLSRRVQLQREARCPEPVAPQRIDH